MKRVILPLAFLGLVSSAMAQTAVRQLIRGDKGISQHYVMLKEAQQFPFSEAVANSAFGLDADLKLSLKKAETDDLGNVNYRFYQLYKGLPVEGAMYIVQTKGGKAIGMSGEIVTDVPSDLKGAALSATVSKDAAVKAAIQQVGAKEYAWQNSEMEQSFKALMKSDKATYAPTAKLVWYNVAASDDDQSFDASHLVLAYKIDVYAKQPLSRANYFVDARTGKVLGKNDIINTSDAIGNANTFWSGTQKIHSSLDSGTYTLRDYTKGNGVITLHGESGQRGNNYTSTSANWNLTGYDQAAMDAHFGVSSTYNFYAKVFKRNSYDGMGTALVSYVNDPTYTDNAFWDGAAMNFNKRTGSTGGVTGIDVTGHELTHGVTQTTSELIYKNESGAINESMSDIMGKSVQFYTKRNDINWQLSNDMGWIIRDMSNPNLVSQPDTYKGKYWAKGLLAALDNGGVHTNSGIGNYMYYLLCVGGSGTNDNGEAFNVKAVGYQKACFIMYRTETVYLFPAAVYTDWRTAAINAATDLYGANSQTVKSVQDAFHAIGVGDAATLIADKEVVAPELKITPNPIAGSTAIVGYEVTKAGNTVLTITNINAARTVQTISLGSIQPGKYSYRLTSAATLPTGSYMLNVEQNGTAVSHVKFMVTK